MLATPNSTQHDPELAAFLKTMANLTKTPLASFNPTWYYELGEIVKQSAAVLSTTPAEMVKISAGKYRFEVEGVEIEGGGTNYKDPGRGVDVQYPWEPRPNRYHSQVPTNDVVSQRHDSLYFLTGSHDYSTSGFRRT